MPTDEWIRERAELLLSSLDTPGRAHSLVERGLGPATTALTDAIARTREERNADIERLQAALRQAAEWFEESAIMHNARGDVDDDTNRNATRALHCRQAADLERE